MKNTVKMTSNKTTELITLKYCFMKRVEIADQDMLRLTLYASRSS